jgi:hemerythrin superfamily protein
MDSMIAKTKGKLHGVGVRIEGLVGVFEKLAEEHATVATLMGRMKADYTKRTELWPEIRKHLRAHEQSELRAVYPVLRDLPELQLYAAHHATEAKKLSDMIDRIDATDMTLAMWPRLVDELFEMVTTHAKEEEKLIFPKAQAALGHDRAKELEQRYLETESSILGETH